MKFATITFAFCVAALFSLGMVVLYSAEMMQSGGTKDLMKQHVWGGMGLVACGVMAKMDYRRFKKICLPILGVTVVLLVLTLVIGIRTNGARRWLGYGSLRMQPSELAKLAVILFLAYYGEIFQRQMGTFRRGILVPGLVVGGVLGLIFLQPDVGTTMLIALVSSLMLIVAGIRWRYFLPPLLIGVIGLSVFLYNNPMRSKRIYSWLHLEETKQDVGLQQYQAMIALGSGGWTGVGLGNGRQKLGFVPEHHTDFILSVIGEELGFAATAGIVTAFLFLVGSGLYISLRAPDLFGMLLGCGITFMIGVQAFINMGVVTGTLPNKGMPLPFISYGGSNLMVMLTCVGIVLSVARRAVERPAVPRRENPFGLFAEKA